MATKFSVKLKIYDLSRGMVKTWSPLLIGKQIDGVWHTAVLVYNMEYFYGGGILCLEQQEFETFYNIKPVDIIDMGTTELLQTHFHEYLNGIQKNFTVDKYNIVNWNCNNFTNEVCNFLVGKNIPQYILNTPYEVMSTSKGKLILDMMQSYQSSIAPGFDNNQNNATNQQNNQSIQNNIASQDNTLISNNIASQDNTLISNNISCKTLKLMEEKTSSIDGNMNNIKNMSSNENDIISLKENYNIHNNENIGKKIDDSCKLPSVSLENFFKDCEIEKLLNDYIKDEKYGVEEKKKFFSFLKTFYDNILENEDLLKNRIIYKKKHPMFFNNIHTMNEYDNILSSLSFCMGFVQNNEATNLQHFTIYIDMKKIKSTTFQQHLHLVINKEIFLKNKDPSIYENHVLYLKDISEYISNDNDKAKNNSQNGLFVFLSHMFLKNNVDMNNTQNDISSFQVLNNIIKAGAQEEKQYILRLNKIINDHIQSLT
ncbi:PPPDE peptidase domain-containing protein [Plasmodium falciparum NF54]|uniref:PPPDE peptidase domain-containing protein, putative n=3 Tax=Plasmodium falciparum TaxID=5833 RepID=Q8I5M9_PLAF7|nr:uncharacterized protein PF3D7_1217900 [Plasmodium falciparum 3D7]KAF4327165.1 PPPDE peptidase domain-containing protein [Plasmodium falciparum NF54]PKC48262.1 PPPDE peptidase domain-containing protein [Plasmodium falciparum NF54]CZT99340.1 PPPDE peptidase domain-containing protein, putative [Plasmodium falciparum 3D7]|eukprot:XP_001350581.1 uncharacterized protein PF3D7_1217900 [Plasmodium falciparum 3D7]